MSVSKYTMGWVGIRCEKVGKASRYLSSKGWFRQNHAQINNRNGFDWVRPVCEKSFFDKLDTKKLSDLGLTGVAMWLSDAQWGKNSAITDKQWISRKFIE